MQTLPTVSGVQETLSNLGISQLIIVFIIFIVAVVIIGAVITIIVILRIYNKKLVVWGKIGNHPQIKWTDKGRTIKLSPVGDKVFFSLFKREWFPFSTQQVNKNELWYWEKEDGDLCELAFPDIDLILKQMKVVPVRPETRMAYRETEDALFKRLQKPLGFWGKYGGLIVFTMFIFLVGIMVYLSLGKFIEITSSLNTAILSMSELVDKMEQLLASIDNLKTGGSGLVQT